MTNKTTLIDSLPVHQNTPSDSQSGADDMSYISPEEGDLLFRKTDPELYAFLKGAKQ